MKKTQILLLILLLLLSCNAIDEIEPLLQEIHENALNRNTEYFEPFTNDREALLDHLLEMIVLSKLTRTYRKHIDDIDEKTIHLNYHVWEPNLHFQLYLVKKDGNWQIEKMKAVFRISTTVPGRSIYPFSNGAIRCCA